MFASEFPRVDADLSAETMRSCSMAKRIIGAEGRAWRPRGLLV